MKPLGQGRIMTRDKKQIQRTINRSQELPIDSRPSNVRFCFLSPIAVVRLRCQALEFDYY